MLNWNIHKNGLLQILKAVYTDTALGPLLGFKGGTAAHFFYKLSRLSVDLDFDLLDPDQADHIFEKMKNLLLGFGKLSDQQQKRYTLLFVLAYPEGKVKIEINRRSFGSQYKVRNYLGIPMLVMTQEDMFAHKLAALLERKKTANRDVFDIWFFLQRRWPLNHAILERRTGMPSRKYFKQCVAFVEKLNERRLLSGVGELLDEKQKTWAKANLKKDVLFLLKARLASEI